MTAKHSYKEIERQRREEDILAGAEQLLVKGGYASLNMDELANLVGISKPTLYQHFKGKEELAIRVLLRSFSAIDDFLSQPLDEPAIDRLVKLLRRFLAFQSPGGLPASLRSDIRPEMMITAMRDHAGYEDGKRKFFERVNALVDQAKTEGSVAADIPTPIVTHMVAALGQSLTRSSLQAEFADNPAKIESAVNAIVRVFVHGVEPLPEVSGESAS